MQISTKPRMNESTPARKSNAFSIALSMLLDNIPPPLRSNEQQHSRLVKSKTGFQSEIHQSPKTFQCKG
jgi:hypothetical protein